MCIFPIAITLFTVTASISCCVYVKINHNYGKILGKADSIQIQSLQ